MNRLVLELGSAMVVFLPVLFGAVEYLKATWGMKGKQVEAVSVGLFVLFGLLVVGAHYYPGVGTEIAAVVLFMAMCVLAPSGFYKFVDARTSKAER